MVVTEDSVKRCRLCKRELPNSAFHAIGAGKLSSRCKRCHGVGLRVCLICRCIFIGKAGRKTCSELCHDLMCAPTYYNCKGCGKLFGPIDHLKRKFCSKRCAYNAASTGRMTVRKTCRKARSAQSLLRYHVEAGHVLRPSECEQCGATNCPIEGAHYNYDEPLRVRWLCRSCHRRWDNSEPKGATYIVAGPGRRRKMPDEKPPTAMAGVVQGEEK